jgi:hypothetical protein
MTSPEAEGERPHKPDLDEEVAGLVETFRDRLMATAMDITISSRKGREEMSTTHLEAAYRRITISGDGPRNQAQKNITAAIKANRLIEYASYFMAAALFTEARGVVYQSAGRRRTTAARAAA